MDADDENWKESGGLLEQACLVADSYLWSQGLEPAVVYRFLKALDDVPDLANITVHPIERWTSTPAIYVEYKGNLPWGGMDQGSKLACAEYQETARILFERIAEYTGAKIWSHS